MAECIGGKMGMKIEEKKKMTSLMIDSWLDPYLVRVLLNFKLKSVEHTGLGRKIGFPGGVHSTRNANWKKIKTFNWGDLQYLKSLFKMFFLKWILKENKTGMGWILSGDGCIWMVMIDSNKIQIDLAINAAIMDWLSKRFIFFDCRRIHLND